MQKIGDITSTATTDGHFSNGSVATGVSPTILDAAWFNTVQDELVNILTAAGMATDGKDNTQVLAALGKLFLSTAGRLEYTASGSNLFSDDKRQLFRLYANNDGTGGLWDVVNKKAAPLVVADATKSNQAVNLGQFILNNSGDVSGRKLTLRLPGGFILKAVNGAADSNGWFSIPFDTPFPNQILFAWGTERSPNSNLSQTSTVATNLSLSSVTGVAGQMRSITSSVGALSGALSAFAIGI